MELTNGVYTIVEAARLLACEPYKLINKGILGELKLLVRVPDHLDAYNAGYSEVHRNLVLTNEGEKPKPFRQSDIEFLVLPEEALTLLAVSQVFVWGTFVQAGRLCTTSGEVEILEAVVPPTWPGMLLAHKSTDVFHRCFATYRPGLNVNVPSEIRNPQKFKIDVNDLLLSRLDLARIVDSGEYQLSQPNDFPQLDVQPHTSRKLQCLYTLFCRVWAQFSSPGFLRPQGDAIFQTLKTEFRFSKRAAGFGAQVIASNVTIERDDDGALRIVAEQMSALILGATFHWKPLPGVQFTVKDTETVTEWFEGTYGWAKSPAEIASVIIRPDYAPRGRPSSKAK
ncbi:hypothetical protein [Rugamonas rivuli]|uniref:Uncharacterized protein n=1 Tax=Rugamonas rivuli TaxID=2743358 RepID=A0A843SBC6_9BURK|nr:hypothetical protein [Rugamonas rivuli]MQA21529.1 hypothetical protein [Rugamonas rivuli]